MMDTIDTKTGLELLRVPFTPNQIGKLPKGTKKQNDCPFDQKKRCNVCGGFHHPDVIHLDYVGHASLTDRLLDADPLWTWEPFAITDAGLPCFDMTGGLWIRLTVCGHTRIGYGNAAESQYKDVGSREKEVIGDALRNAAMRFGAALDLWHKGELHVDDENGDAPKKEKKAPIKTAEDASDAVTDKLKKQLSDSMGDMTKEGKKKFYQWLTMKYVDGTEIENLQLMIKDIEVLKKEYLGPDDIEM